MCSMPTGMHSPYMTPLRTLCHATVITVVFERGRLLTATAENLQMLHYDYESVLFFFQAEDGIRYWSVTGVQTCALPICQWPAGVLYERQGERALAIDGERGYSRRPGERHLQQLPQQIARFVIPAHRSRLDRKSVV